MGGDRRAEAGVAMTQKLKAAMVTNTPLDISIDLDTITATIPLTSTSGSIPRRFWLLSSSADAVMATHNTSTLHRGTHSSTSAHTSWVFSFHLFLWRHCPGAGGRVAPGGGRREGQSLYSQGTFLHFCVASLTRPQNAMFEWWAGRK